MYSVLSSLPSNVLVTSTRPCTFSEKVVELIFWAYRVHVSGPSSSSTVSHSRWKTNLFLIIGEDERIEKFDLQVVELIICEMG